LSRRSFLHSGALTVGAITALSSAQATEPNQAAPDAKPMHPGIVPAGTTSFLPLLRVPDGVSAFGRFEATMPAGKIPFMRSRDQWTGAGVAVDTNVTHDGLETVLTAPAFPIVLVHLRWQVSVKPHLRVLGDAWERSYGDLGWRNLIPERVMPWYFATYDGQRCCGYGVKTDARALCFWQLDPEGVSLWLNVANGGNGVELSDRELKMATVVSHQGTDGEGPLESVTAICRGMCARSSRKPGPVYGANDWDYSYGRSTAKTILRDTETIVELSPKGANRPFSVIDGGWTNGTAAWPDMGDLATSIKKRSARPGIWIRPLEATSNTARSLLLPDARFGDKTARAPELAYDPTIPEAREKIGAKITEAVGWGFEMVKHDFSTYDLLGQWGFEMGPQPTLGGWSLYDRSRTNAEVVSDLYELLRQGAGQGVVIDGCNTIGHLGQGYFDLQRSGDDTSGRQWERTRRMGVNTLAFRLPQHGTFFTLDADLIAVTEAIPWGLSRQWLELVARSGTATLLSIEPSALQPEQRSAIRDALQMAAAGGVSARPTDWMESSVPQHWRELAGGAERKRHYTWNGTEGASPFLGP